jgi:TolB-like protein/DNA-binding winged helix-turn-helix (wHTH) protein
MSDVLGRGPSAEIFDFADLRVDVGRRIVSRGMDEIPLPKLSFDLLLALLQSAPNVVSIDEFMQQVWPGLVVSPETVSQRVKLLRDALGDDPRNAKYVVGVRGLGYRVIPSVSRNVKNADASALPANSDPRTVPPIGPPPSQISLPSAMAKKPAQKKLRKRMYLSLSLLVVLVVVGAFIFYRRAPPKFVIVEGTPFRSVAVLPFDNLSADHSDDYLALGLSEMVLNRLAGIPALRVSARTSSFSVRRDGADPREIGRKLNARYLVKGSVQHVGQQLRVMAQVLDVDSGRQFTAMHIDKPLQEIFDVQDEIADRIAISLAVRVGGTDKFRPEQARNANITAYLEYLQGRSHMAHWTVADMDSAASHFQRAIDLDPQFAAAYAGLAMARELVSNLRRETDRNLKLQEAKLIEKALSLDDGLGEAYVARGALKEDDPVSSEADFRKGLQLSPSFGLGYAIYADSLESWNRHDDALQMIGQAISIDPLSPRAFYLKALFIANGNNADAEREAEALMLYVLELDPNFTNALVRLAQWKAFYHGETAEAIRLVEKALRTDPDAAWIREDGVQMYLEAADPIAAHNVIADTPIEFWYGELCLALYAGDWRKAADLEFNRPKQLRDLDYDYLPILAIQWYGFKTKEFDRAIAFLKSTYHLSEGREFEGHNFDAALSIAILTKQRGDRAGTRRLVNDALRVLKSNANGSASTPAFDGINRAILHILTDQYDLACDELIASMHAKFAGTFPYGWTLDKDPLWDPIRADPRFQAVEKIYRDATARQHSLLLEMRRKGEVPPRNAS